MPLFAKGGVQRLPMQLLMSSYDTGGADSTTDLQTALAAAAVVAQAHGRCQLILDSRDTYVVGGAVTAGANGQLAQIPLPFAHGVGTCWVEVKGQPGGDAMSGTYFNANGHIGTVIKGTLTAAPAYSATTGIASIFGGAASYCSAHASNAWRNDICYSFDDLTILQPNDPPLCCLDLGWTFAAHIGNVSCATAQVFDGTSRSGFTAPTKTQGMGVIFPFSYAMNPPMRVGALTVEGFYTGVTLGELLDADFLQVDTCVIGVALDASAHGNSVNQLLDINNVYGIGALDIPTGIAAPQLTGRASFCASGHPSPLAIHLWDIQENNGQTTGMNRVQDLYDTNNLAPLKATGTRIQANVGAVISPLKTNGGRFAVYTDLYQRPAVAGGAGDTAWILPTLLNSWVNFGSGEAVAGYRKDALGVVHLNGTLKSGTSGPGGPMFTLPAGYRPLANTVDFLVPAKDGTSHTAGTGHIAVSAAGSVFSNPTSGSGQVNGVDYIYLDGVTFLAEQ